MSSGERQDRRSLPPELCQLPGGVHSRCACGARATRVKLKHWSGSQTENGRNAAPALEFALQVADGLSTSRNSRRRILPTLDLGSESRNTIDFGFL